MEKKNYKLYRDFFSQTCISFFESEIRAPVQKKGNSRISLANRKNIGDTNPEQNALPIRSRRPGIECT